MPMIRPTDFARALSGYFFEYLPVHPNKKEQDTCLDFLPFLLSL